MAWRPGGDPGRGDGSRVHGGIGPRRPDQRVLGLSRAGSGPAPQNFVIGRFVLVLTPGPGSGLFVYNGTPAHGNLIASIAAIGGTDPYNNAYLAGIVSYSSPAGSSVELLNNALLFFSGLLNLGTVNLDVVNNLMQVRALGGSSKIALNDASNNDRGVLINPGPTLQVLLSAALLSVGQLTSAMLEVAGTLALANATAPASVAGFAEPYASGGRLLVVDGADANKYQTERLSLRLAADQLVNATADTVIAGLQAAVAIGQYRIQAVIQFVEGAAAGSPRFTFHGPALTDSLITLSEYLNGGGGGVTTQAQSGAAYSVFTLAAMATHTQTVRIDGYLTFSVAGTLSLQVNTTVAADTYTVKADSFMDIMPAV